MRKKSKSIARWPATLAWLSALPLAANAMGLAQLYERALQHDPGYQANIAQRDIEQTGKEIARSALLPRIAYRHQVQQSRWNNTAGDGWPGDSTLHHKQRSQSSQLTLTQPILDLDALARYRRDRAQAGAAQARLAGHKQALAMQVAERYTAALYANDELDLTRSALRAYGALLAQNRQRLAVGEATRTDVLETQVSVDLARAQLVTSEDTLSAALADLAALTGVVVPLTALRPLADAEATLPLTDTDPAYWISMAQARNPEFSAQRYGDEAASQEIARTRAMHYPQLTLHAALGTERMRATRSSPRRNESASVSLQLSIPLYSGGAGIAGLQQAMRKRDHIRLQAQERRGDIMLGLQKSLAQIRSSRIKARAYRQAVAAADLALRAMQYSVAGGERVNADVLASNRQYYAAKRDLAQARYTHILAWLSLKFHAGVLQIDDLMTVDALMLATPASPEPWASSRLASPLTPR